MIGRRFFLVLTCTVTCTLPALAQQRRIAPPAADKMTFTLVSGVINGAPQRWVAAQGAIKPDTGSDFDAFLKAHPLSGEIIRFDSAGGSIVGALRLGHALRKAGLGVSIGKTITDPAAPLAAPAPARLDEKAGVCYSSCAYAFLGGARRSVPGSAALGVHMFWPGDQLDRFRTRKYDYAEIERVHRLSAQLAIYLNRMGIDPLLLDLAARTPPRSAIRVLKPAELKALNIVTSEPGTP